MKTPKNNSGKTMIASTIDPGKAIARIAQFRNVKLRYVGPSNHLQLVYDKTSFLAFLSDIADPANAITGLRVYFACVPATATTKEALTLVYAPTIDATRAGVKSDLTDQGTYYIGTPSATGEILKQNATTAPGDWIRTYRKKLFDVLSGDLGRIETRGIWYSKATIKATYDDITQNHSRTTYITVSFAAYLDTDIETIDVGIYHAPITMDLHRQLTLIFSTDDATTLHDYKETRFEEYYDTGAPCPPDPACINSDFPTP